MSTGVLTGAEPWDAVGTGARAGVTVIVVHGLTANPRSTGPLARAIAAAGFGVDVLRLRGHGSRMADFRRSRYEHWVDDVRTAVARARAHDRTPVLVGHSLGGTVCLDVASTDRDIPGLAVINPQVLAPQQALAKVAPLLQFLIPVVPRDLAGLPSDDIAKEGVSEGAYTLVASRAAQSLVRALPRLRRQLPDLTQPLLVIRSPQDHTVPVRNSEVLPELVGSDDVEEVVCERSYHSPHLDHDADLVQDAVVTFIARVTGR